jgi:membrane protease YdiL (CAAX protease family)
MQASSEQISAFLTMAVFVFVALMFSGKILLGMKNLGFDVVFERHSWRRSISYVVMGVGIGVLLKWSLALFGVIIMRLFGNSGVQPTYATLSENTGSVGWVLGCVTAVAFGPVVEECGFRGLWQSCLNSVFKSRYLSLIVVSGLFCLMHDGGANGRGQAFLSGIVLGFMSISFGSLIPGIVAHMVCNGIAFSKNATEVLKSVFLLFVGNLGSGTGAIASLWALGMVAICAIIWNFGEKNKFLEHRGLAMETIVKNLIDMVYLRAKRVRQCWSRQRFDEK